MRSKQYRLAADSSGEGCEWKCEDRGTIWRSRSRWDGQGDWRSPAQRECYRVWYHSEWCVESGWILSGKAGFWSSEDKYITIKTNKQLKHTIWLAIARTVCKLKRYPDDTKTFSIDGPSSERTSTLCLCASPNHFRRGMPMWLPIDL